MPRPRFHRRVAGAPLVAVFKPVGIPARAAEEVQLTLDEFEAIRLADMEALYQARAAEIMHVSRQTFGRIVGQARKKVAQCLVQGKALRIEGGVVAMAGKRGSVCAGCGRPWREAFGGGCAPACPSCRRPYPRRLDGNAKGTAVSVSKGEAAGQRQPRPSRSSGPRSRHF